MKHYHEEVADLHKQEGGAPMQHHHELVEKQVKTYDGGMPMKHHHEHVAAMCGGGMTKGKK